jgi:hypothetical protein
MNVSPLAIQLAVVLIVLLAVAAWTFSFLLRSRQGDAEPLIRAQARELKRGWYQVDVRIANRAPYGLTGVSLRRVRPRAARLMAPITSVSTPDGDFQVWSDPSTESPKTSIPLCLEVGPREERHGIVTQFAEALATAWLFLPETQDVSEATLELSFVDRTGNLRRFRFGVALARLQGTRHPTRQ